MLPRSVDIVVGDVGDPSTVKSAVSGCSKIIYCATARSTITGDLNRVDNQGVRNVSKAFQVFLMTSIYHLTGSNVIDFESILASLKISLTQLCITLQDYYNELAQLRAGKSSKSKLLIAKFKSPKSLNGWEVDQGSYFPNTFASRFDEGIDASFDFSEAGQAVFSGITFCYVDLGLSSLQMH